MASKVLVDANIFLDYAFPERPGHPDAINFIQSVLRKECNACTTPAIIHISSYHMQNVEGAEWARGFWKFLTDYIEIIDLRHDFAVQAIHSNFADLEDALQYFAGIQHSCTHFISSDKALRKTATTQLPVLSAKQFLQLLK